MDKALSFPEFVGRITKRLSRGRISFTATICPERDPLETEDGLRDTEGVRIIFEFFSPRKRVPKDDLGGEDVNNHAEPGFFRRMRILHILRQTAKKDLHDFPFFNPKGRYGISWERSTEEYFCRTSSTCSSLRVVLYFKLSRKLSYVQLVPDGGQQSRFYGFRLATPQ